MRKVFQLFILKFTLLWSFSLAVASDLDILKEKSVSHICYLSLNIEDESSKLNDFVKSLEAKAPNVNHKVKVVPVHEKGQNPQQSFQKLVQNVSAGKQKCDGLVISGHHTGAFGGNLAQGQLDLAFMERLSCNKNYSKFFKNIKSVWLQGCRTVGDKIISSGTSAQDNTFRVAREIAADGLELNMNTLDATFSLITNKDNPISSRYLRMFPRSSVLGWTGSAPGEKVGSHKSIPFHIAHLAKIMDKGNERYFKDPLNSKKMTPEVATRYMEALLLMLNKEDFTPDGCPATDPIQDKVVKAWNNHGYNKCKDGEICFANNNLEGYSSGDLKDRKKQMRAMELGCNLNIANKRDDALDEILKDEELIGVNYNKIINLLMSQKQSLKNSTLTKLRNSEKFRDFLKGKFDKDSNIAILTKLKYLKTSEMILGDEFKDKMVKLVINDSLKILNDYDKKKHYLREYKLELFKRLSLLGIDTYEDVYKKLKLTKKNKENYKNFSAHLIRYMTYVRDPKVTTGFFRSIIKDKTTKEDDLIVALTKLTHNHVKSPQDFRKTIKDSLSHSSAGTNTLSTAFEIAANSKPDVKKGAFLEILNSKNVDSDILLEMKYSLSGLDDTSKKQIKEKIEFLNSQK